MNDTNLIQDLQNTESPIGKYTSSLFSPNGIALAGCLLGIVALSMFSGGKKGKLATSYFGGGKETAKAKKKALKQILFPKCDSATLYIGRHKFKNKITKREEGSGGTPLYIPDVQRGTAVVGAPGSGKSFSAINPMIYSAIDQGFPIVLYDFKYPTQAKVASYAKKMGYEVHVFAPGFPESEVCNPLDFLRDATDAETARQLATVINKNFKMMASSNDDAFFGPAGDQLTEAILMLTKETQYPDIMTAAAILSSERMVERLMAANLNPWIRISFGQLFSSAGSEKTVAGIAGTASLMFTRFMKKNTLGCFVGKTTLPLEIKGKQMIIFGLDRERRDAVGPLLCSILHMTVARAIAKKRKDPLIVVLDEVPSLYLPDLFKWLNESRSEGFCGILGWQNMGQLEKYYGKEVAKTILGACGTKFIFNPGEEESARLFSSYLGDEEIKYKQKSKSTGGGKTSTSVSDQEKTRKLFEPAQFLKLPPGKCIFINPAYSNKDEASVPLLKAIKVPKALINIEKENDTRWENLILRLTKKSTQRRPTQEDLDKRIAEVYKLFPIPQEPVQAGAAPLPVDAYKGFL
ncbi:type IV secretion system DNA-binding domain-containing protein [Aetokthonos hydrillicola Thurmond2011]|uniref:Type IV secretion system DNA-binding domain-containing protein n=1 Tax=Aetokthonos hydrillicola Thurmond2011 TaxID=2712845 RepID=A0AAP5MC33_9CYAN|nr:type IV secretion system DNA-binding domain-containing protein [Aetokthonos hydrillicola]MBO3458437.1 type IV secretory system conjugative DNA transfer family protein [Aetokthonos hydrillicola CCALA 1050]MBW4586236.1 type IV secretion system DNA-binding domain-containing protein [Aetokthonos hydrillicola CCALA 1050]MDR9897843.1 type IV secretion system DNA-binding domain-containing protein [Aetokthonos hydrillicola Thurmond2011]